MPSIKIARAFLLKSQAIRRQYRGRSWVRNFWGWTRRTASNYSSLLVTANMVLQECCLTSMEHSGDICHRLTFCVGFRQQHPSPFKITVFLPAHLFSPTHLPGTSHLEQQYLELHHLLGFRVRLFVRVKSDSKLDRLVFKSDPATMITSCSNRTSTTE
jgi:hypothetical protein